MRKVRNIEKSQPFAGFTPPPVWRGTSSETLKEWASVVLPAAAQPCPKTKIAVVFHVVMAPAGGRHKSFARL